MRAVGFRQGGVMAHIVLLTGNHLCHNPRVLKEATVLAARGHAVTVLGAWFMAALKRRDQDLLRGAPFAFEAVVDLTGAGFAGAMARFRSRLRAKGAASAFRVLGRESASQLGYAAPALCARALRVPADLYIAHSEAGLAAASALLDRGFRVGADMEDWFSEDLAPEERIGRPLTLLRRLEARVLRASAHSASPSRAMSMALSEAYGCRPPAVVYNAFAWADRQGIDGQRRDRTGQAPSVHWVSQTLGPGRGLEELLAALPMVERPFQVHLRGVPVAGFELWLSGRIPAMFRPRVFTHDLVSNDKLLSRIAEHDIGFAGEQDFCRSRNLTVTNKILHYLCGGLPVVASATAGQIEVAGLAPGAVFLYPPGDAPALARAIDGLLGRPDALAAARQAALAAAEKTFSWEVQAPALVQSVEHAL